MQSVQLQLSIVIVQKCNELGRTRNLQPRGPGGSKPPGPFVLKPSNVIEFKHLHFLHIVSSFWIKCVCVYTRNHLSNLGKRAFKYLTKLGSGFVWLQFFRCITHFLIRLQCIHFLTDRFREISNFFQTKIRTYRYKFYFKLFICNIKNEVCNEFFIQN